MKKFIFVLLIFFFIPFFIFANSDNQVDFMFFTLAGSIIALIFAFILAVSVLKKSHGTEKMQEISNYVQEGAMAYLYQQYKVVGFFFIFLFIVLLFIAWIIPIIIPGEKWLSPFVPIAFLTGGFFSGLSGFIGMKIATKANCRTAFAASKNLNSGLRVAFNAGTVMGMVVVGLGLFDIALWWILLKYVFMPNGIGITSPEEIPSIMITFGMGASTMALFARLGGGIYTKAADVGADLVGKVEVGIPEDDPRNPATIADNVGDNVGDVAGMGADLYESYVGSIVATMALGSVAAVSLKNTDPSSILKYIELPGLIAITGVICSILGTFLVKAKDDATQKILLNALRRGIYFSTGLIAIASLIIVLFFFGKNGIGLWLAIIVGLLAGNIIGYFTEYFTSDNYKPTKKLAETALTGPATVIIGGISLGMMSTAIPVITIVFATLGAYYFSGGGNMGLYGIGLSAVGMLSTLGITLATDAYGPVADNAGGIAEMAHLDNKVRERTDALDMLGNTTAATGKGFAIGSAALTALALLAEYGNKILEVLKLDSIHISEWEKSYEKLKEIGYDTFILSLKDVGYFLSENLLNPLVLIGVFIGALMPFIFSAMSMGAVGRAAKAMVEEVRRQFKEKPGILEGTDKPDYARCVQISTKGAQKEMIIPSLMAVITPIIIGIIFGPATVLALLSGALCSGFILAIMMANSGGAWDNAKKFIEKGNFGGKRGEAHKAAVVGDTVGDPFKDTSGPCINILLKLMSMVSIVFVGTCIGLNSILIKLFNTLFK